VNRSTLRLLALLMVLDEASGPLSRGFSGLMNRAAPLVLDNIDLDALLDELDIDAIAERLDLDALISRMDIDAVAERLDLDTLISRMDINAVAQRLDIDELASQVEIATLVSRGSQEVAESGIDLVRRQIIRLDIVIDATVRTLLRRDKETMPVGPGLEPEVVA
jgi:hypothetical protein